MARSMDDPGLSPPERSSGRRLEDQHRALSSQASFSRLVDALPDLVMVVNSRRQAVYVSRALRELLAEQGGAKQETLGQRPGELLGCCHAEETPEGCGGSPSCRLCGAAGAIAETQNSGRPAVRECRLSARRGGRESALNFAVSTAPFSLGDEEFVLVSFRDVSHEKRKAALERIFFHDLLNTASSLKVYLNLLRRSAAEGPAVPFVPELEQITDALVEEIQSQKMLVSAENGTLQTQANLIVSREMVEELIAQFAHDEIAGGKQMRIAPFSESFGLVADASILRRVLANAVKNALEAAAEGETVTIACRRQGDSAVFEVHNPGEIPPEAQLQLFRRYFSTKGEDRGLGTYGMKLLTEEYLHGTVGFQSDAQRGTSFRIAVPLRGQQEAPVSPGDGPGR